MARILVAGSGAIGAFIAYHLAARGARGVVLCDRGEVAGGSTGKAMGGVRQQFSDAIDVELARRSVAFFESMGAPHFEQVGYLFAARTEEEWETLHARAQHQRSLGVPVEELDRAGIARVAPGVRTDDFRGAVFCGKDGLADPPALTREIARRAAALGVEIRERADARSIDAEIRIVAAGAYSAELARHFGLQLPIRPLVRQLFETTPIIGIAPRLPMVIESESGFHFRRRGDRLRVAMGDDAPRWSFEERVDESVLADRLARLAHRLPASAGARVERAWAGLYDMTPDSHPIVGKIGDGLFVASGFSGHGFMHSPAIGEAIAELVLEGRSTVDLRPFALERFKGNVSFGATSAL